jgi:hypothetical protein
MNRPVAAEPTLHAGRRWQARLVEDLRVVVPAFVVARLLVLAGWVGAGIARGGSQPTDRLRREGLLAWDGTWYRDIIELGYAGAPPGAIRYFPGYPLLTGGLATPFGGGFGSGPGAPANVWALLVVANVAALMAGVLMRRLVLAEPAIDHGSRRRVADRAAITLTVFPTAFVLAWAYSEALFLVACIGAFWMVRSGRWWWAAPFGLLAGLTRPLGVLLMLAIAVEALRPLWDRRQQREPLGAGAWLARSVAVLAPLAGTAAWGAWVGAQFGDPMQTFTVQSDLRGEAVNPLVRFVQGFGELFGPEMFGDGLHLPFVIAAVALLVVTFRRLPVSYGLFAAAVLAVALAAENLNSFERYALNGFPIVVALAALCTTRWRTVAVWGVGGVGITALSLLAWIGVYVP